MCIKSHASKIIIYESLVPEIWSMTDRIFLSFWAIFWRVTPLTPQKIKILKKWKKCQEMLSFYPSVPKIMIICYIVPAIWHRTDIIFIFHVGLFLHFYPTSSPKNEKKKKKRKKMPGNIIILHMRTKNYNHLMHGSWDKIYNGQTEKVTYRGGCPT